MATAARFSLALAFRDAAGAARRFPRPLLWALLANIVVTMGLAWIRAAEFDGNGLGPWIGRLVVLAGYAVVDATLGVVGFVVALEAMQGRAIAWGEAVRRALGALGPALLLAALGALPWALANALLFEPPQGPSPLAMMNFPLVVLADIAMGLVLACTIGLATFAAVTGTRPLPAALARSWRLVRRARWKLALLSLVLSTGSYVASDLVGVLASWVGGGRSTPLGEAVGQLAYTVWWFATVVLYAGVGLELARVEATRDPDLLADHFA